MFIHLQNVDSTNNYLAVKDLPAGTVVWADSQTAGRGRGDHSFASPKGGIYFSCLLKEKESENDQAGYIDAGEGQMLTPKAAVAVCKTLEELCGLKPSVKWVNDIFLSGKKVCGILCEHVGNKYIAGIGINIKGSLLPEDLQDTAGGIADKMDDPDLAAVLKEKIIKRIAKIILEPMSVDTLLSEYSVRLGILNKKISFTYEGEKRTGIAEGINEYCNLIVRSGRDIIALSSGEIQII